MESGYYRSLSSVVSEERPKLLAFARLRLRDLGHAEDAVQDTALACARIDRERSFQAKAAVRFVWRILFYTTIDLWRRRSVTRTLPSDSPETGSLTPLDILVREEELALIRTLIDELSDAEQKLIYDRFFLDKTIRRIAAEMRWSVGKTHAGILNAIQKLTTGLARHYGRK